jgi:hypothetical protein
MSFPGFAPRQYGPAFTFDPREVVGCEWFRTRGEPFGNKLPQSRELGGTDFLLDHPIVESIDHNIAFHDISLAVHGFADRPRKVRREQHRQSIVFVHVRSPRFLPT